MMLAMRVSVSLGRGGKLITFGPGDGPGSRWNPMTHTVCEPCNDCKYTDCVAVCPCDCFYQDERQLYIDPDQCIDCAACQSECPVDAIFPDIAVPAQWSPFVALNADR